MTHPRGCYVELVDGRTACYGRSRTANGIKLHEISINGGGIAVVGENEIKSVDDSRPGWCDAETHALHQEQRAL